MVLWKSISREQAEQTEWVGVCLTSPYSRSMDLLQIYFSLMKTNSSKFWQQIQILLKFKINTLNTSTNKRFINK